MRLLGIAVLSLSLPSLVFSQGQPSNPAKPVATRSVQHSADVSTLPKVAPEKPTPMDKDATGKPRFATYEDYIEALVDWKVSQRVSAYGKDMLILPESDSQRFQIVFNPNVRADTFLLDTKTGRIWRNTAFTDLDASPDLWVYMERADNDEELREWAGRHLRKEK